MFFQGVSAENLRFSLFKVVLRLLLQFFGKWLRSGEVVLKLLGRHHGSRYFQANTPFGSGNRDSLKIGQKRMVFLRGAKVPRTGVRVTAAMSLHGTRTGNLANTGHCPVSLLSDNRTECDKMEGVKGNLGVSSRARQRIVL